MKLRDAIKDVAIGDKIEIIRLENPGLTCLFKKETESKMLEPIDTLGSTEVILSEYDQCKDREVLGIEDFEPWKGPHIHKFKLVAIDNFPEYKTRPGTEKELNKIRADKKIVKKRLTSDIICSYKLNV